MTANAPWRKPGRCRTTRQVKVTADGSAYHDERVARLLADLEDADASLSSASAAPRAACARCGLARQRRPGEVAVVSSSRVSAQAVAMTPQKIRKVTL